MANGRTVRRVTNSEMIRSMTDDELAEALCEFLDCDGCPGFLQSLCIPHEGRSNGLKNG